MPYNTTRPLTDRMLHVFNPLAGTSTGTRISINAPGRAQLLEAGFVPCSLVASAMTLAVAINNAQISSAASSFTQCITSTLGTFSSTVLYEGACASVNPPSPAYVNGGDTIQFTASGGNSSAIGATFYAILRAD